jgi:hypothetical protein
MNKKLDAQHIADELGSSLFFKTPNPQVGKPTSGQGGKPVPPQADKATSGQVDIPPKPHVEKYTTHLRRETIKWIKLRAVETDRTDYEVVQEALDDYQTRQEQVKK